MISSILDNYIQENLLKLRCENKLLTFILPNFFFFLVNIDKEFERDLSEQGQRSLVLHALFALHILKIKLGSSPTFTTSPMVV